MFIIPVYYTFPCYNTHVKLTETKKFLRLSLLHFYLFVSEKNCLLVTLHIPLRNYERKINLLQLLRDYEIALEVKVRTTVFRPQIPCTYKLRNVKKS